MIAFTLEGLGIIALGYFGHNPYAFLILSGVVFLAWLLRCGLVPQRFWYKSATAPLR